MTGAGASAPGAAAVLLARRPLVVAVFESSAMGVATVAPVMRALRVTAARGARGSPLLWVSSLTRPDRRVGPASDRHAVISDATKTSHS